MSYIELCKPVNWLKDFSAQRITGALPPLSQRMRRIQGLGGAVNVVLEKMRKYQVSALTGKSHSSEGSAQEQFFVFLQPAVVFSARISRPQGNG